MIFNDIIRRIRKGVNRDRTSKKYGGRTGRGGHAGIE